MTVSVTAGGLILLEGLCPIEDAEVLQRRLLENPQAAVDWSDCEQAHTAVIQVLLAAGPQMTGAPPNPFLREHIGAMIGEI